MKRLDSGSGPVPQDRAADTEGKPTKPAAPKSTGDLVAHDEIERALEVARGLIRAGVPVFVAKPARDASGAWDPTGGTGGTGYVLPTAWQRTPADLSTLDDFEPGDALGMVCGHGVDVVDVDPRNGGDASLSEIAAAGIMPTALGEAATPSDGTHYLVNGVAVRSRDGVQPGLDVKAGKDGNGVGFVFIAPTVKRSKVTGEIRPYRWTVEPNLDEIDPADESGAALADLVESTRTTTKPASGGAPPTSSGDGPRFEDLSADMRPRTLAYVAKKMQAKRDEMLAAVSWPEGYRTEGEGKGWERLVADLANLCGRLARAPWCSWTTEDAHREYLAAIPAEIAAADRIDVEAKWREQHHRREPYPFPTALTDAVRVERFEANTPTTAQPPVTPSLEPVLDRDVEATFWESTPELATIRDYALARLVSPWAVLGAVLVRVAHTIPPGVRLPATIGSPASLNLFAALVGPSGAGKGAAVGVAAEVLDVGPVDVETPGSGEGIPAAFVVRRDGMVQMYRHAVVFDLPEVDTLAALGARQGATLDGVLRAMWSGERLGFAYRDPAKRLPVEAHTYRAGLIVGVQPERAGTLFDAAGGGTPQRFVWLPVTDPRIGEVIPDEPEALRLAEQRWPLHLTLTVPDEAAQTVRDAHVARMRGEGEALDGHALLVRLKVAQLLTVLCGRRTMTLADWERAGVVMAVSDRTREAARRVLSEQAEREQKARGRFDGIRAGAAAEVADDIAVRRVAQVIARKVTTGEGVPRSHVRSRIAARDRDYFDEALDRLVAAGTVEVVETSHGQRLVKSEGAS